MNLHQFRNKLLPFYHMMEIIIKRKIRINMSEVFNTSDINFYMNYTKRPVVLLRFLPLESTKISSSIDSTVNL